MPNVSTYIRADDLAKYLEVSKKPGAWSEFIHNALNQGDGYSLKDFKDGKPQADMKAMSGTPDVFKSKPTRGVDAVSKHPDVHYPTQPIKAPKSTIAVNKQRAMYDLPIPKSFSARKKK